MIGAGTCLRDDSRLNVRGIAGKWREPYKVLLDTRLEIPGKAALIRHNPPGKILVFTSGKRANPSKLRKFTAGGIRVFPVAEKEGLLDLNEVLRILSSLEVASVLVEGGGKLAGNFFDRRFVDKFYFFYAPFLLGGREAPSPLAAEGVRDIKSAVKVRRLVVKKMGIDYLFEGYPDFWRGAHV
jgi:diaminohydroxyphosphoribosylaminopyrimidine deaminase/5-amino-6-(5-phosphoribosylamino)uracil reductase